MMCGSTTKTRWTHRFVFVVSSFCGLCHGGASRSAPPTPFTDVLRLTPGDAGFYVIVQGWREQIANLTKSPAVARLAATSYGRAILASADARKLSELDEHLQKNLGVSWAKLRDEILGDVLVIAYTPGPPDKPEAESGILLLHVRRPDLLRDMLERLTKLQTQSGEVTNVRVVPYRGYEFIALRKKTGAEEYYLGSDQLLAVADKEAALKAVVDRHLGTTPTTIQAPPLAGLMRGFGVEKDFIIWWLNPRAFDAAVAAKVAAAKGPEAVFLKNFERYWKSIDGAALSLGLNQDVTINISIQAKTHALPVSAQQMIGEAARPSPLWASFPKNALFAAAGRVPWESAVDIGSEFMTADARRDVQDALERTVGAVLGREVLPQLLKSLGPDWGVCVTPPESAGRGWLPSLTAVLRLRSGGPGTPPVEQRVLDGLDFVARLTVLGYNNSQRNGQLRLRVEQQEGIDVRVIDGERMPPGLQPAFAWKGGYLVLASTPDAVRRFTPPSPTADTDKSNEAEIPLLRLTLQGWAAYLRTYRASVTAYLADTYKLSAAEADARINRLVEGLELFDGIEVTQRTAPGRATVTVRLKMLPADEKPH